MGMCFPDKWPRHMTPYYLYISLSHPIHHFLFYTPSLNFLHTLSSLILTTLYNMSYPSLAQ